MGETIGEYLLVLPSYGLSPLISLIYGYYANCDKTMTISVHGHEVRAKRDRTNGKDARRRKRIKFSLPVHVRPFNSRLLDVEDVGEVLNFTQDGLYFVSCMPHYQTGMRLIVTFPFGKGAAQRRFLGTVVRLEERSYGNSGIAVRFLL
ncbi:MAG: PilZ domain-containing protein [Candidatus Acidiferrales bacterium]